MKNEANSRSSVWVTAILIFLIAIAGIFIAAKFYTDWLWYQSLDATQVFATRLLAQLGIFLAFFLVMAATLAFSLAIAYRMRPKGSQRRRGGSLEQYGEILDSRAKLFILLPSIGLGFFAGVAAMSEVDTFLAWWNRVPFGETDPYFNLDYGFFIFTLPWLQQLSGAAMAILAVSAIGSAMVHFVTGSLSASPITLTTSKTEEGVQQHLKVTNPFTAKAQAQLSIIFGLMMLVYAMQIMLDRYGLSTTTNQLFTGISYTDYYSRLNSKLVMAVIAVIAAVIFFVNAWLRRWLLPGVALTLMLVSSLIISMIYPAVVQRVTVDPDEPVLERPFIEEQIAATRYAYGIDGVEIQEYSARTDAQPGQLKADAEALPGIRLMDPAVIAPTFEQLQQVRGYYSFPKVLDVDRYTIDGTNTDAIVAAREIDLGGVPDQTWNNIHTVYTHGYALVAAYGNRREITGEPSWIVGDIPPVGALAEHEPRIYFGERSTTYAIVGAPEGTPPVELDTPGGGDGGGETRTTYTGSGGVSVGSLWRQLLYAIRFGDINLLLSQRVNKESMILYDRTPKERVQQVAPWLTLDGDPYPAIVDGRVVWLLDGYTVSNSFPNSERIDMLSVTSDFSAKQRGLGSSRSLNYIRNAVKAVVDAYDGTVQLYAWDENDPILQTWDSVYPGILKSKSEVSEDLLNHMRYPQDMFKAQRYVMGRYHTTNPDTWYEQSDLWRVPNEPRDENYLEPPYYLSVKWPGDDAPKFSLTASYVPSGRENLVAYLAVNGDASDPEYGRMRVLRLSNTQQIAGPGQTFNAIRTDGTVAEKLRPYIQGSAEIIYGNLLTLPLGGGLMYVQPIYTQQESSATTGSGSYPVLRFVVVRFGEHIGIGDSLQKALDMVFQGDSGASTGEEETSGTPGETDPNQPPLTGIDAAKNLLAEAAAAMAEADRMLSEGNLAGYQAQVELARRKVAEATQALQG